MRHDPDVAGVVSVIGVSPANPTPNAGRLAITLKPRDERQALAGEVIERLQQAVAPIPGVTLYFQAAQDVQIGTRSSRAQYQYTLTGTDAAEVNDWSKRLASGCAASRCCARSRPKCRTAACVCWCGSTASRRRGSACRCRRSMMRSTARSASARSRPSMVSRTSTG